MSESQSMILSLLLAAALGLMMGEALVDQSPDPAGPVMLAAGWRDE